MSSENSKKANRLKARLPRGLMDREAGEIAASERMLARIRAVYERYGFEAIETPFIEYTDALGKFLPDQDRPNEGVFSFKDDDDAWLSLRYDLTAPLARYVAERFDALPKPFRSYRAGYVFRNEKPGPGRFRQFMQFDADTVGAASPAADAEMAMMMADVLEAVGIKRGDYLVKVSSRKLLDGIMDAIGLGGDDHAGKRLQVLRAIDKLDRLGGDGVRDLLGQGRKDESGDFTKGVGLDQRAIERIIDFTAHRHDARASAPGGSAPSSTEVLDHYASAFGDNALASSGIGDLRMIADLAESAGYGWDRVRIDPSVVRGLEYYTGAVFEAELTFTVPNEKGQPVVFGSVGGGGRYDGLIGRFRGDEVPATGFSIGVSRLFSALKAVKTEIVSGDETKPLVVVLVMDRERIADYQRFVSQLRQAEIRAEMYLGDSGMKAQMRYADKRNAALVVIQGADEKAKGEVQLKDLAEGARQAKAIASHEDYKAARPAQFAVSETELVTAAGEALARQRLV